MRGKLADTFSRKILAQHKAKGEEDQALEADAVKKANKAKRKAAAKPAPVRKQAARKGKSNSCVRQSSKLNDSHRTWQGHRGE
jgi:hypothetical protein